MSKYIFNINDGVLVKIKDAGIEHYVKKNNSLLPFEYHTSYREFKAKADADGYHYFQMHTFMDYFGSLGMKIQDMIHLDIVIKSDHLIPTP